MINHVTNENRFFMKDMKLPDMSPKKQDMDHFIYLNSKYLITKAAFNNRKFMNNLAFVDQIHVQFACQVARGHGGRGGGESYI